MTLEESLHVVAMDRLATLVAERATSRPHAAGEQDTAAGNPESPSEDAGDSFDGYQARMILLNQARNWSAGRGGT